MSQDRVVISNQFHIREGIIFCVELSESLYTPSDELKGNSVLKEILQALDYVLAQFAILIPNVGIGCYFFNSSKTSEDCESNVYRFFGLQPINTRMMKKVRNLLDDVSPANGLPANTRLDIEIPLNTENGGKSTGSVISGMFTSLKKEFIINVQNSKKYNVKKIFYITDNDKPFDESEDKLRKSTRLLLDDLDNAKVNIVPFFLNKDKANVFDLSQYNALFYIDDRDDEDLEMNENVFYNSKKHTTGISAKHIRSLIEQRKEFQRVQFGCELEIGTGLTIAVKGYSMFSPLKPTSVQVYTDGEEPKLVLKSTSLITKDGSQKVPPSDLVWAYKFGNDVIYLSEEHKACIRKFSMIKTSGLKIIGFRDINETIEYDRIVSASPFVYVDLNSDYSNSFRAFSCLYQTVVKLNKAIIVYGSVRNGTDKSMYALIPSRYSEIASNENLKFPQGFFMMKLLYKENLRHVPEQNIPPVKVDPNLLMITENFLTAFELKKGYIPNEYSNPNLQWHFKILREEALYLDKQGSIGDWDKMSAEELQYLVSFDDTLKKVSKINEMLQSEKQKLDAGEIEAASAKRLVLMRSLTQQVGVLASQQSKRSAVAKDNKRRKAK